LDVQGVEADRLLGVDDSQAPVDKSSAGGAPTILGGGGHA
jgi:hypothetical protein